MSSIGKDLMDTFSGITSDVTGVITAVVSLGILTVAVPVLASLSGIVNKLYPTTGQQQPSSHAQSAYPTSGITTTQYYSTPTPTTLKGITYIPSQVKAAA